MAASVLPSKTPISELKERSVKLGHTPIYEPVDPDVQPGHKPVHPRSYTFKVVVGEYTSFGTGSSKKKARHAGAQKVLEQMSGLEGEPQPDNSCVTSTEDRTDSSPTDFPGSVDNPIGELEWRTHRLWLPPPIYEFSSNAGPPHTRVYTCTARLLAYSATGLARSRKTAKRDAARTLLRLLRHDYLESDYDDGQLSVKQCEGVTLGNGFESEPKNKRIISEDLDDLADTIKRHTVLQETQHCSVTTRDNNDTHTISQSLKCRDYNEVTELIEPYRPFTTSTYDLPKDTCTKEMPKVCLHRSLARPGVWNELVEKAQVISELNSADLPSVDYCAILASLADVKYLDIKEKSLNGQCQCLVQVCTTPTIVCHGSGTTDEQSRSRAAHVALAYLKLFLHHPMNNLNISPSGP